MLCKLSEHSLSILSCLLCLNINYLTEIINLPKVRYEFIMYLSIKQKLINLNSVNLRQYQKWGTQILTEKFPRSSARENRRIIQNSLCKCKDFFTNVLYVIEKLSLKKEKRKRKKMQGWSNYEYFTLLALWRW